MRMVFALAVIVGVAPLRAANVWTTVYRCDEMTPLPAVDPNRPGVYADIMVGTRLVIVVSSDTGSYWWGHLRLSWDDADYAALRGRGPTILPDADVLAYIDSCLEAAGEWASAWDFSGQAGIGLEFLTSAYAPVVPGDWFICDYMAEQVGPCDVGLYDLSVSFDALIETLSFTHVPSRDFNDDTIVNFEDLALLAEHWRAAGDYDRNSPEAVFDLNSDRRVDTGDLSLFCEYWLERTYCNDVAADPNNSSSGV